MSLFCANYTVVGSLSSIERNVLPMKQLKHKLITFRVILSETLVGVVLFMVILSENITGLLNEKGWSSFQIEI